MQSVSMHRDGFRAFFVVCVVVVVLSSMVTTHDARAAGCAMVPTVSSITVNQGIDEYSPLAWGKEALVRPYLVLPSCAKAGSIKTSAASLTVSVGAGLGNVPVGTFEPHIPISSPKDITACCTPSSNSPADPLFLIDPTTMAQGAGEVSMTFALTVTYVTSARETGTVQAEATRMLGKRPNPLRLLMVPMGNNALSDPFTTADRSIMQAGLGAVSRMFPVANGFDTLSATSTSTAGIRWQPTLGVLDLGPGSSSTPGLGVLNADGKFCGNDSNMEKVKLGLVNYLQGWNAANQTAPVDRAAGVVSSQTNLGSSVLGCNNGQAAAPGNVSWTGLRAGTSSSPSITGAVLAQELTHNFGVVSPSDALRYTGWHSRNTEAETSDRAYNLTTRQWLSSDRSVMKSADNWNQDTTLLEAPDWAWTACSLGGSATGCAAPGATGSPASNLTLFEVSGTTDGSKAGTRFVSNTLESGTISEEAEESTDPSHPNFMMVFRSGSRSAPGAVMETRRMEISFESTDHHSADTHDASGTVNARFVLPQGSTLVEIWRGQPDLTRRCAAAPSCLYDAEQTARPQIVSMEVTPTQWTFDRNITTSGNRDESDPALSTDGEYVAFVERAGDCGALVVVRLSDESKARLEGCGAAIPREPAISPDSGAIAFVRDGDLWRVAFNAGTMSFGAETKIYSCVREAGACVTGGIRAPLSGPASSPSWSPMPSTPRTDQWLAFSVQNDIYRLYPFRGIDVGGAVGVAQPERLTMDENSDQPTVGPVAADGSQMIAFRRQTPDGPSLFVLDVTKSGFPTKKIICCARFPSWGGELIAYENVKADGSATGRISFVNPDNPAAPELVSATGTDSAPALVAAFGRTLALQRTLGSGGSKQDDILIGRTTSRRDITMIVRDPDNAAELDGYIYGRCGGADVPIAVALRGMSPDPADPNLVAFVADDHETSIDCHNATSVGLVSDDFSLSEKFVNGPIPTPFKDPVAAIMSPAIDARVSGEGPITLAGMAWDAEGMVLPDSALQWAVKVAGATGWRNVPRAGGSVDVTVSDLGISGGTLPAGIYQARLTATDSEGRAGQSIVDFFVTGPRAVVDFEPNQLYVPSSGNPVTLVVSGVDGLSAARSARIVAIDGVRLDTPIEATSWRYDAAKGTAQGQFDRQRLSSAIPSERIGQRVLVTIEGCSKTPWACGAFGDVFSGADPSAPQTSPA